MPPAEGDLSSYSATVDFLNRLNTEWVAAMQRVSPAVLIDVLDVVGPQYAAFVGGLDPDAPGVFPVAWAAESESKNCFDIGRDYTELWHHQAQIRVAVGAQELLGRLWLHPVLRLAVRGLRRGLSQVRRDPGTAVVVRIEGEAGGLWTAMAAEDGWMV